MSINKVVNLVGFSLSVFALMWFGYHLVARVDVFSLIDSRGLMFGAFACGVYAVPAVISSTAWYYLLKAAGESSVSISQATMIYCVSQFGKYVPGNIAHHVGRVVLAKRHGLSLASTLFTMFMETVCVIAIAVLLSLVMLWSLSSQAFSEISYVPEWWAFVGMVGVVMVAPIAGHRIFEKLACLWAQRKGIEFMTVHMPPLRTFWLVGFLYSVNFLIMGLILQIVASQIFGEQGGNILLLSGIFAVAWVAGFITPGAPAGLGVREVVLVAALAPVYGNEVILGIVAALRMVTLLGDGVVFLTGLGIAHYIIAPVEQKKV